MNFASYLLPGSVTSSSSTSNGQGKSESSKSSGKDLLELLDDILTSEYCLASSFPREENYSSKLEKEKTLNKKNKNENENFTMMSTYNTFSTAAPASIKPLVFSVLELPDPKPLRGIFSLLRNAGELASLAVRSLNGALSDCKRGFE